MLTQSSALGVQGGVDKRLQVRAADGCEAGLEAVPEIVEILFRGRDEIRLVADSEVLAEFPVNASPGRTLHKGVTLLGIGDSVDDTAFVSYFIEREPAAKFKYFVTGHARRGRPLFDEGSMQAAPSDSAHAYTFTFRQPLSTVSNFRLSRCPIREINFREVSFRPKAKK